MLNGDVVLWRNGAARAVHYSWGDGEGPRSCAARAGEVDGRKVVEVLGDRGWVSICEEQAHGAGEVPGQAVDAIGLGVLGGCPEGACGEFCLAEEESAVRRERGMWVSDKRFSFGGQGDSSLEELEIIYGERGLTYRQSFNSCRTSFK